MAKIIGIDLGTTNSVCAVLEGGEPTVITNPEGQRLTPSVVAFTDNGERLVSWTAKRQAVTNPRNTVYSIKRFMGRRHGEVAEEEKMVPYEVTGGSGDLVKVRVRDKEFTPPEISAMVLRYIKEYAEEYLGEEVKEAVITVPAYFNDSQRQATKDAGRIAGLEVKRIINEPTAAALAYGLDKKKNEKVAVYDLGGGTFDVSILEIGEESGEAVFDVLSTNGDTHLGGDNFDEALIEYVAGEFKKTEGVDLRDDQMALQRLGEACEKAKCELSSSMQTTINLPFITAVNNVPKHLTLNVTRAKYEDLVKDLVLRTKGPCEKALADAKLKAGDVDEVILVGGSSRMPCVQAMVKQLFGKEPNKSVNPDEAVAVGAAIQAGILQGDVKDVLLLDVTPLSLGIETKGGVFTKLIERNTTIPTKKSQVFSTAAHNQTSVEVHVLQGERAMAIDNRTLGRFHLAEIPAAPAGMPQIEVSFNIDANGILNVTAKDLGTNKEQSIQIQSSSGLSEQDIQRMQKDAEANAADDAKKRELIEARNKADSFVLSVERDLKEHGDKVDADTKAKIEEGIKKLNSVKDGDDKAAIESAMAELEQAGHKLAEVLYKEAQAKQAAEGAAPEGAAAADTGKADDNIQDADFKVKE